MNKNVLSRWPTPTQQLLIRAAMLDGDEALRAWRQWQTRQDMASLDPGSAVVLAKLYRNLTRLGVPESRILRLRDMYRQTWAKNQEAKTGLILALDRLASAGVPVIVFKGMPLALLYYRDLGARSMSDIDLLVRAPDLARASRLLTDAGWQPPHVFPPVWLFPYLHALAYGHSTRVEIDLHWQAYTVDCPAVVERGLWSRAVTRTVDGVPLLAPDTTDLFVLTCFSGRKGDPQSVCRWVMDALVLVAAEESPIDWRVLGKRARATGLSVAVRECLIYLQREFDVALPGQVLAELIHTAPSAEERRRDRRLVRGMEAHQRGAMARVAEHWYRYSRVNRVIGRPSGVVGFLRYLLLFYQFHWGLARPWEVPLVAFRRRGQLRS